MACAACWQLLQFCPPHFERTRPLLGTYVSVRVRGLAWDVSGETLDRCFTEVREIHHRMSFQEFGSDVSLLNREAHRHPVRVDARTFEVLRLAAIVSSESHGAFDVTVAPHVVAAHAARPPAQAPTPHPGARWTDVELLPDQYVCFKRPLWLDLSGIAKGYAVDRVIGILSAASAAQACVNAGGELRVSGHEREWVQLGVDLDTEAVVPTVQLQNESIASSGRRPSAPRRAECPVVHFDGSSQRGAPSRFVSVLAPTCAVADALTKVVMARGSSASGTLRHFGARALMSDGATGWCEIA